MDLIVADTCYKALLTRDIRFVPLPHIAMSARFHWDMPYAYAVEKGSAYLAEALFATAQP